MNRLVSFLFIAALLLGGIACEQKQKSDEDFTDIQGEIDNLDDEFFSHQNARKMLEIEDRLDPLKRINSLVWEKQFEDGNNQLVEVEAYLNDDGFIVKIIEFYTGSNYADQGERNFYLEDNKIIAITESKSYWIDAMNNHYLERRSVYENGELVSIHRRDAPNYEETQEEEWRIEEPISYSLDLVNDILAGEGEFETHFISVIKADQLFLLLGENKDQIHDRYTTAIRVDHMTPFIEDLLNNLDEYKFRPVNIQFTIAGGENEAQFRVLTNISWKE